MLEFHARPSQARILAYRGGWMGISAVPGAGKTYTLSRLAAQILLSGSLRPNQEVLIVTLVNSAVDNFATRVGGFVQEAHLMPGLGYRVRTLHGLAHDIVRIRPEAVGLSNDFQIIDDGEAARILADVSNAWLRANFDFMQSYLKEDLEEYQLGKVRHDALPELVRSIAVASIRYAKDLELTPDLLRARLDELPAPLPLAEMGWALYADYQRAINYRGAVDFDDLIRLALRALETDASLVSRLREQWPYILEDEAQDSSRLQEKILGILSGAGGNWVRVGDPNQAIYETFTTASPEYLLRFRERPGVSKRDLPESGRSMQSVMDLANYLIDWSQSLEDTDTLWQALAAPHIRPTGFNDPQPNPIDNPERIHLHGPKLEPLAEISLIADSLDRWLKTPEGQERTVAVLVPRNTRGFEVVDALRKKGIDVIDSLLNSTSQTRDSAGALSSILAWLSDPSSSRKLAAAYRSWRRAALAAPAGPDGKPLTDRSADQIHRLRHVEDFLAPIPGDDWLSNSGLAESDPAVYDQLARFRVIAARWQAAVLLPIDQLLLALAQDIFTDPPDLAIAHKMAGLLRQRIQAHPGWQLPELSEEVAVVARNERKFLGFSQEDTNFDPDRYKGKVVVATIHKAKGMEWDRVYLLSANNYDFPSGAPYDQFISEKWFIRGSLNLEAEALAQFKVMLEGDEYTWYEEGAATRSSRVEYARERLRLLYVGITRARQELIVTWNSGRDGRQVPARAFQELRLFWESQHGS
jgi:DNA helicase II / ATP-dependent DNA helicase PcrA